MMEKGTHFVRVSEALRRSFVEKRLDAPVEIPATVTHEDLYKVQVLQGRQIHTIEQKLIELEHKPVLLSNFQKVILGVFLAGSGWVLNNTHQNSLMIASALATLTEINDKVHEVKTNGEVDRRLRELEAAHPRTEPTGGRQ